MFVWRVSLAKVLVFIAGILLRKAHAIVMLPCVAAVATNHWPAFIDNPTDATNEFAFYRYPILDGVCAYVGVCLFGCIGSLGFSLRRVARSSLWACRWFGCFGGIGILRVLAFVRAATSACLPYVKVSVVLYYQWRMLEDMATQL